jgi:hypothetical protein
MLCQGQQQVDALGYSALPINLVEDGYAQLQKVPGNSVPTATSTIIQQCHNPTFSTNGTNTLADTDPQPAACDKQGPTQCTTATGGAKTSTPVNPSAAGSSSTHPSSGTSTGAPTGGTSSAAAGSSTTAQACDPDSGSCTSATGSGTAGSGTAAEQQIAGVPTSASVSLGDGLQVTLMALAAVLLLGLVLTPPLVAQVSRRRRQRRFGPPGTPGGLL